VPHCRGALSDASAETKSRGKKVIGKMIRTDLYVDGLRGFQCRSFGGPIDWAHQALLGKRGGAINLSSFAVKTLMPRRR
jgi:hypothetical protein